MAPVQNPESSYEGSDSESDSQSFVVKPVNPQPSRTSHSKLKKPKSKITNAKRPAEEKPENLEKRSKKKKKYKEAIEKFVVAEGRNGLPLFSPNETVHPVKSFMPHPIFDNVLFQKGLQLLGESKKAEFEKEWNKVQMLEMKVSLYRLELISEQTELILEAIKLARS